MTLISSLVERPTRKSKVVALDPFYVKGTADNYNSTAEAVLVISPTSTAALRIEFPKGRTLSVGGSVLCLSVLGSAYTRTTTGAIAPYRIRRTDPNYDFTTLNTIISSPQSYVDTTPGATVYFTATTAGYIEVDITPLLQPDRLVYTLILDLDKESLIASASSNMPLAFLTDLVTSMGASFSATTSIKRAGLTVWGQDVAQPSPNATKYYRKADAILFAESETDLISNTIKPQSSSLSSSTGFVSASPVSQSPAEAYLSSSTGFLADRRLSSSVMSSSSLLSAIAGSSTKVASSALYASSNFSSIPLAFQIPAGNMALSGSTSFAASYVLSYIIGTTDVEFTAGLHRFGASSLSSSSTFVPNNVLVINSHESETGRPFVRYIGDHRTPEQALGGPYIGYILYDYDNDLGNTLPVPYFDVAEAQRIVNKMAEVDFYSNMVYNDAASLKISAFANIAKMLEIEDVAIGLTTKRRNAQVVWTGQTEVNGEGTIQNARLSGYEEKVFMQYNSANSTFSKKLINKDGTITEVNVIKGVIVGDLTLYPIESFEIAWMLVS